ncbi:hypothetical protein ACQF36_15625 [Streptomyces sp. Marseille-Q5077]|uniref:hypothetical protein n=1 Tax=Streptomyces sp. Marseille-Q5077 TaxID=3418995 RepID=UPI003CFD7B62
MARRLLTLPAALLPAFSIGQPSASAAAFANPVKAQKGADLWIPDRAVRPGTHDRAPGCSAR